MTVIRKRHWRRTGWAGVASLSPIAMMHPIEPAVRKSAAERDAGCPSSLQPQFGRAARLILGFGGPCPIRPGIGP
jgi:hypothetical protein